MAYFYRHPFIGIESRPEYPSEINIPELFRNPTEEDLSVTKEVSLDNFTPIPHDPLNWFIFDPGSDATPPYAVNKKVDPNFLAYGNGSSVGWGPDGTLQPLPIGGIFNDRISHGNNFTMFPNGGPRNMGYTKIDNGTWLQINNGLIGFTLGMQVKDPHTEVWREGSIELTIKPEKENCTILSGTLFPRTYGYSVSDTVLDITTVGKGPTVVNTDLYDTGQKNPNYPGGNENQNTSTVVEGQRYTERRSDDLSASAYVFSSTGSIIPDYEKGYALQNVQIGHRTFSVKLVDGKIKIIYEIPYGPEKRKIEFTGKQNIVDGQWHHIVINRPSYRTKNVSEQNHVGNGSVEIWIDGQLDNKTYEITSNMLLPVPMILFNDSLNVGVLNYQNEIYYDNAFGRDVGMRKWSSYLPLDQYVGGVRDFVFRHTKALSKHYIHLNYVYAMLNGEGAKIIRPTKSTAKADIVQPSVSTNKPIVLKLYWNTLLKEKEKCLNGLEFDENYQVYSYSTTHQNILSPTQTMNLDLNTDKKDPTFLTNVKTAIGKTVYTPLPGIQYSQDGYFLATEEFNFWAQYDITNDAAIARTYIEDPRFVNNLLYANVFLEEGDRVLLFNQPNSAKNGVWIFNGPNKAMTRPYDLSGNELTNVFVYVEKGKYKNTTFYQKNIISNPRDDSQNWVQVDNEISIAKLQSYPIHGNRWINSSGDQDFININTDIDFNYDVIAFANFPENFADIIKSLETLNEIEVIEKYKNFINNLKIAVNSGKSIFISSPQLAIDFGIVDKVNYIPQLLNTESDAQSAAISPFESGEVATNYFDTHRNNKYHLSTTLNGLTNKQTYIMTDFVTYSPDRTKSDYHIKYNYRQFGLLEGDEFYIPGLTTLPETLNEQLPGYLHNQKSIKDIPAFAVADINYGTAITKFTNTVYSGSTAISNPYDDYITTIAGNYGSGKVFVNCVEDGYAFSREDYNKGVIQNVTSGQNGETVSTAAWQYSTKRLNKKDLYDFSEDANPIGQTDPTLGGGGGIIQSQSHCSNSFIRKQSTNNDLKYQSDLYPDYTEETFTTTEIPVLSMTWLGLKWLAE